MRKSSSESQEDTSAQVILRPRTGSVPQHPITSETIQSHLPSAEQAQRARKYFQEAGFEVGPLVANSFSITAPAATFEKVFQVKLKQGSTGTRAAGEGSKSLEIPLKSLPRQTAEELIAVTFTPPPDFGPGSFGV